jgi:hypothetical protein
MEFMVNHKPNKNVVRSYRNEHVNKRSSSENYGRERGEFQDESRVYELSGTKHRVHND